MVAVAEQLGPMRSFVGAKRLAHLGSSAAEVHAQALHNLGQIQQSWRWVESATPSGAWLELYVAEGELAAERILDRAAMRHTQELVAQGKPLAVAIPHQGFLLAASPHVVASGSFTLLVRSLFDEPSVQGAQPLTPLVFLMDQGRIVGHTG